MNDVIIIGAGPAGAAAALTLCAHGRSVLVIAGEHRDSGLFKAKRIDNYPGMPGVSGAELLSLIDAQLAACGAQIVRGVAVSAAKLKSSLMVSVGADAYSARALILAVGAVRGAAFPGEEQLLGRGVSYCAVCDGAFYKGKRVVVLAMRSNAEDEAETLRRLGCLVTVVEPKGKSIKLEGESRLRAVQVDDDTLEAECAFILRPAVAPDSLLPGLALADGAIQTDRACRTNIDAVYAAGDCAGKPLQIAKAVGDGLIAAFSVNDALSSS
ncbi:MAG: FAD-dependent oxidoreductase [Oscillospiraceae bacterium]|jgi:thioredoxin reductase (NADPH)|nr:FAD-dependent oxidoreductase [Oscillospiraceae bacterium]